MKGPGSAEIRQMFLDFFREKGHDVYRSASLIPVNDPTLLWINSGVATLKKYFDGSEKPENPRITNSQKCIRTNDIENVGYTARHHTLFEMLGNFSIGDYFKNEAIPMAWEFLTSPQWIGLDPEKLYVTYYPEDEETRDIWLTMPNFNPSHIAPEEGNFWDIGAGPCGPNTEIFYDRGPDFNDLDPDDPENYPGGENEQWLEIWNLVFSEYNHLPDDSYQPLPQKNVDTGMGLERLASVLQGTETNFETDLFMPIINKISQLSGVAYDRDPEKQVSFKVIADHMRAVAFAVSDGALPSNEGRGYILRRLIRRSVMHGRRLDIKDPFLADLIPVIVDVMGGYYQELQDRLDFVQEIISREEQRFHETIEGGEAQLADILADLKDRGQTEIPGSVAFKMYDTFGFPLELTQEEANHHGMTVDVEGFNQEMAAQQDRARSARSQESSMQVQKEALAKIDSDFTFVGYDRLSADGTITYIVVDDQIVDHLPAGETGWVFFNRSPFYAEMGGQIADTGGIYDGSEYIADITDVQKAPNGQFMHQVTSQSLALHAHQSYTLNVQGSRRHKIMQNHTATHLLHQVLKEVLGNHANQAGSYVGPDRLRFDFSHFGKMTDEEIQKVEDYVNEWILKAEPVVISEMTMDEAKAMGAMALFGEKYGHIVRVVNIGNESIELCGGTHVLNTKDISTFKILSESGIGAGIRRIEAVSGPGAIAYYQDRDQLLNAVQDHLKLKQSDQILSRIDQIQSQLKEAQAQLESLTAKALNQASDDLFAEAEKVGDITYIAVSLPGQSMDNLRNLGDRWRDQGASNILVLATDNGNKANLMVFVDSDTVNKGIKAGDLIKPLAKIIGGGGGGRPEMAQAGGKKADQIQEMLANVPGEIENICK